MPPIPQAVKERLAKERNVWIVTVRTDGRPHLVPVWFTQVESHIYVCIEPQSVKGRNLRSNRKVCLALEDTVSPVICEGEARVLEKPWPAAVVSGFVEEYGWDISAERRYIQLVEITPRKWLHW